MKISRTPRAQGSSNRAVAAASILLALAAGLAAAPRIAVAADGIDPVPAQRVLPEELQNQLREQVDRSPATASPNRRSQIPAKTEIVLLNESFEGSWPAAPWSVSHPTGAADVDWGRSAQRASDSAHSIWCAASGSESPGAGGDVPANSESWVIVGPFDLSEAALGTLSFDLWLQTEAFYDAFLWLTSTDGALFSGLARSTDTAGWKTITADLTDFGEGGDVTGEERVWFAFVYLSDRNNLFEGAYVDKVSLIGDSGTSAGDGITYTSDADFELGTLFGVETASDSIQLAEAWSTAPYLWVPNFTTGTVSKVDTGTGNEIARYRTGPEEQDLVPLAVAVDLNGSCWIGNYDAGTVVKIGASENGGCVDRNNSGSIDTSTDSDGNGDISGTELLAWGADECVAYEIVLVDGSEAVYVPGTDHGTWQANGLDTIAVDADNNVWVGVYDSSKCYRLDGSSAAVLQTLDFSLLNHHPQSLAVDGNGILWSAGWPDYQVLRIDPSSEEITAVDLEHGAWGLAVDDLGHLFVSGFSDAGLSRIDVSTALAEWAISADLEASGMAISEDGDVWLAASAASTVTRLSNDGVPITTVGFATGPTNAAIDAYSKVWVVGWASPVITRINPLTNLPDVPKDLVNAGGHEAAGDMTGVVARNVVSDYGTWTVDYDSLGTGTAWGTLSWTASAPGGTSVSVRVRSSTDQMQWSTWETAGDGILLTATPSGRYLQIEVGLQRRSGSESPVLEELTVVPNGEAVSSLRRVGGRFTP